MSDVREPNTLLLRETGIARLKDGREAVNVGPIVAALGFLTEGRGEDRGTDEDGTPLPDLLSLAFDVVRSIIVGGRHAEHFRQVKRDFDAQVEGGTQTSLALAKQASAVRRHEAEAEAEVEVESELDAVTSDIQARLASLKEAAAQLVHELAALQGEEAAPRRRRKPAKAKKKVKTKPVARAKAAPTKKKPRKA